MYPFWKLCWWFEQFHCKWWHSECHCDHSAC